MNILKQISETLYELLCREDVTILEINSEARIEFFLVFVALMTWGVPAYYGIQIINLQNEGVEILRAPFFQPRVHPGKPKKSPLFGKKLHIWQPGNKE